MKDDAVSLGGFRAVFEFREQRRLHPDRLRLFDLWLKACVFWTKGVNRLRTSVALSREKPWSTFPHRATFG
jgi:hypothetical protein